MKGNTLGEIGGGNAFIVDNWCLRADVLWVLWLSLLAFSLRLLLFRYWFLISFQIGLYLVILDRFFSTSLDGLRAFNGLCWRFGDLMDEDIPGLWAVLG